MAKSRDINAALKRLADAEAQFLASEFLAPVIRGGHIHVRIAGVICKLQVQPREFEGWGVFRPTSHADALLVRQARLAERQHYLDLFPLVRLILAASSDGNWLAVPAHQGDARFHFEGLIPVRLPEDVQLFELIETNFDGSQFWYRGQDVRHDPTFAVYLREELGQLTPPEKIGRSGLTAEERHAYAVSYWPRYEATEDARRSREENRLRSALEHAGADLKGYVERQDVYSITYEVDGQRHTSVVSKRDLSVQAAGICLSGQDANFDLQSLVGVIREGQAGPGLVRLNEDY